MKKEEKKKCSIAKMAHEGCFMKKREQVEMEIRRGWDEDEHFLDLDIEITRIPTQEDIDKIRAFFKELSL